MSSFNGRLTLSNSEPFMTTDTTSGVVYYLPVNGLAVSVFDGTTFVDRNMPESGLSASLAGLSANTAYDVFVKVDTVMGLVFSPMGGSISSGVTSKMTSGFALGGMTAGGGLASAFNGSVDGYAVASSSGAAASGYAELNTIGRDWGTLKSVSSFKLYSPSDDGFRGDGASIGVKLQGWDGSAWIDLWTGATPSGTGKSVIVSSGITANSCTKHRVILSGNSTNYVRVSELEFYETTTAGSTSSRNLERKQGILTNANAIGSTPKNQASYVGSILIDSLSGVCTAHFSYGANRKFGVWNMYNQAPIMMKAGISYPPFPTSPVAGSTGYTPNPVYPTWGAAAQSPSINITVFTGLKQSPIECNYAQAWRVTYQNGAGNASSQVFGGIGWDSTTTPSGTWFQGNGENFSSATGSLVVASVGHAQYTAPPSEGSHVVTALESRQGYDCNAWCLENNMCLSTKYLG